MTIKVRALEKSNQKRISTKSVQWKWRVAYLIAYSMRNVSAEEAPSISTTKLLNSRHETINFFRSPFSCPLINAYEEKLANGVIEIPGSQNR